MVERIVEIIAILCVEHVIEILTVFAAGDVENLLALFRVLDVISGAGFGASHVCVPVNGAGNNGIDPQAIRLANARHRIEPQCPKLPLIPFLRKLLVPNAVFRLPQVGTEEAVPAPLEVE
jgi:hypothetical protein